MREVSSRKYLTHTHLLPLYLRRLNTPSSLSSRDPHALASATTHSAFSAPSSARYPSSHLTKRSSSRLTTTLAAALPVSPQMPAHSPSTCAASASITSTFTEIPFHRISSWPIWPISTSGPRKPTCDVPLASASSWPVSTIISHICTRRVPVEIYMNSTRRPLEREVKVRGRISKNTMKPLLPPARMSSFCMPCKHWWDVSVEMMN